MRGGRSTGAAYACWPLALIHGLGTGTDTPLPWMLFLSAGCLIAVLVAVGWRVGDGLARGQRSAHAGGRLGARLRIARAGAVGRGGAAGAELGARAGTPTSVLASVAAGSGGDRLARTAPGASQLPIPFSSRLSGVVSQRIAAELGARGARHPDLAPWRDAHGQLGIQIEGEPLSDGGVTMQGQPGDARTTG